MRICYLTTVAPCGDGETFVLHEIDAVQEMGHSVRIFPTRPENNDTQGYDLWRCSVLGGDCWKRALAMFFRRPLRSLHACGTMFFRAGSLAGALKSLYFFPKALAIAHELRRDGGYDFIHAHWLGTVSSVAYIAAALTDLPFGITGHRWDVYGGYAFVPKAKKAAFIRAINDPGRDTVRARLPEPLWNKVFTLHLGVELGEEQRREEPVPPAKRPFQLCMPANLIPVKGHIHVLEALRLLRERGADDVHCIFYGEGELRKELERTVREYGLEDMVSMPGYLSNQELLAQYRRRDMDAVILSSVTLSESEHEGIPVSLMEAMSWRIPVIAADSGGTAELVRDAGCLVPEKDPQAIAAAIERLKDDPVFYAETAIAGWRRVLSEFDNLENTRRLVDRMEAAVHPTE